MRANFLGRATIVLALLASGATAQKLTVPDRVLNPGETIQVEYTNPGEPGATVAVVIDNGAAVPEYNVVTIALDERGVGSAPWTVPDSGWMGAVFNAPGCAPIARAIAPQDANEVDPGSSEQEMVQMSPVGVEI